MPETPLNPINGPIRSSFRDPQADARADQDPARDDDALIERLRRGDETAMTSLFDRYSRLIYSVALRVLQDPAAAEDVTQEVFLKLWRDPRRFPQNRGSLGAWLVVVVRNQAVDLLRRKKPQDAIDDCVLVSNLDVASEAEQNNLVGKIRGVLKNIPPEQREALELAFFGGLSHAEIAVQTGEPLGTVKTRIRLALIGIRKAFSA